MALARGECYYLDTSALVKRYVKEPGSEVVDSIYTKAYRGVAVIAASYWNVTEAAVVFDKYERRLELSARQLMEALLRESRTLAGLLRLKLVPISPALIRETVELVLKHHVYSADALQIASARYANCKYLATADSRLAEAAAAENLETITVGVGEAWKRKS